MFEFCNDTLKAKIEEEVKNLTPEEVHEITKDALREYLKNPDVMQNILFDQNRGYYPSSILVSIMEKVTSCIDDEYFNSIASSFAHYLKENHKVIARELIDKAITNKIREIILSSNEFEQMVSHIVAMNELSNKREWN